MLSAERRAARRSICCHIDLRQCGEELLVVGPSKPGWTPGIREDVPVPDGAQQVDSVELEHPRCMVRMAPRNLDEAQHMLSHSADSALQASRLVVLVKLVAVRDAGWQRDEDPVYPFEALCNQKLS